MNGSILVLCSLVVATLSALINNQPRGFATRDTMSLSRMVDGAGNLQRRQAPVGAITTSDAPAAAPGRRSVKMENLQKRQAADLLRLFVELRKFFGSLRENTTKVQTALGKTGPVTDPAKTEMRRMFDQLKTSTTALEGQVARMGKTTGFSTEEASNFFKTTTDNAEKLKLAILASNKNPDQVRAFFDQLLICTTETQKALTTPNITEGKKSLLGFMNRINPAMANTQKAMQ